MSAHQELNGKFFFRVHKPLDFNVGPVIGAVLVGLQPKLICAFGINETQSPSLNSLLTTATDYNRAPIDRVDSLKCGGFKNSARAVNLEFKAHPSVRSSNLRSSFFSEQKKTS